MQSRNNIAKNSLVLTITQFITLGVNLLNAMILSRFRSLEEYGTYSQIIMISTIIITFLSAGFSQCINYFIGKSENETEKKQFVKNYYSLITIIGILGGGIALLLLPVIKNYFGNQFIDKFWFLLFFYPISHILTSGIDRFFIAYYKTKLLLVFKVGHSVIILTILGLTIAFNLNFYQYSIIYTIVEVLVGISVFMWIHYIARTVPFGLNKSIIKEIMVFALPMAFASLISTINTEMDKLVIGGLVDTQTLAIYANAAKELPIYIFSTSISSVVMPCVVKKITKKDYFDAVHLWRESIKLSAYIICFFVTALFVFAPQIISLLYSDKYLPGTNVFRIYSLVLLFRLTYYGMILNATGKTKTILKASIVTMIVNLSLDIVLYKLFGIIGPAIATFITVAVMNIYQLLLTCKMINVKINDIYPIKENIIVLFLNVIMGGIVYFIQQCLFKVIDCNHTILSIFIGINWMLLYFLVCKKKLFNLWNNLNKGEEND